jgi:hypothetical protein
MALAPAKPSLSAGAQDLKAKLALVKSALPHNDNYNSFETNDLLEPSPSVVAAHGILRPVEHKIKQGGRYRIKAPSRVLPLLTPIACANREATNRTRKFDTAKRHEQEFRAHAEYNLAHGGRYNPVTRRSLSPEGLARKQASMDLYNSARQDLRALLNRPPTEGLPFFYSEDFRSSAEHKLSKLIAKQDLEDVSLSYSERSVSRASDVQESWFFAGGTWHRHSNDSEISVAWAGGISR